MHATKDEDDEATFWREHREQKRLRRLKLGMECPQCKIARPKAHASILMPGQKCKIDGYVDRRPRNGE